jgi:nucleotide-binding universal stress UspA family protein
MATGTTTIAHGVELKNIAVLTDLGSEAEKPLRFAAALAQGYGAKLTVAHACKSDPFMYIPPEAGPVVPVAGISPDQAEEEIRALISGTTIPQSMVSTVVGSSTVQELLKQLLMRKPDLLVLATHARSGLDKWLSGSVTEEVFRKAKSPVLVLPPTLANTNMTGKKFQKILLATDLSDGAASAVTYAMGIAERNTTHNGGRVVVLYVHSDATSFYFERLRVLQRLEEWLHRQNLTHLEMAKIECIVRFGKTTEEIKAAAALYGSELIVLGARGYGALSGLASHFVGGTAYEVACTAECPVLIVPDAD